MVLSASSIRSSPKITFSPGSIQLSGVRHRRPYNTSNGAIFKLSLGNYCCKRIQRRVNSDPSFLDVPKHKLLAYLRVFG
jgi:hypothetical protein